MDAPEPNDDREAAVAREIRRAGEAASTPVEVYRAALARVTPLVDASFASVFLGELRIREGRGPTGQAVARGRPVEVADVFDDPELEEWWEPARELGFTAMTAHPLSVDGRVVGSISFYFQDPQTLDAAERSLLTTVARELAAVAESVRS